MNETFETIKCPVCGKYFAVLDRNYYGWKFREDLFCSYTCMRKVETKYLAFVNKAEEKKEKRVLPEEYNEVYRDLMLLRQYSKQCDRLRRSKYDPKRDKKDKQIINAAIEDCCNKINVIKGRYAEGVLKLDRSKYELLVQYVLDYQDTEKLVEDFKTDYDDICDRFISILGVLKDNIVVNGLRRRWISV